MNKFDNVPYLGAIVSILSVWGVSEWAAVFGILFGFATLAINFHYKRKEYQLKLEELKRKYPRAKDNP
ncbi:hypothetical protein HPC38_01605 [Pasteurellaceae bacterium HPA106]|uniref:HP1 family phage holin n=1 Tax=Spirabiliibacterium pneumoniae TaxID=221400 RepID=UPI001AADF35B|nr:HP1 family phage holin [Spirabiliibacterium pneumoniae]MBE2895571.1 hypothetical protein [Spirabiliibacterium pneumoniae]